MHPGFCHSELFREHRYHSPAQNAFRKLVNHAYSPDKVNVELMDELAKCVLRRPNRFDELNGEKMSDTLRQRLRENVEKEREQRNTELQSSVTQRLKGSRP